MPHDIRLPEHETIKSTCKYCGAAIQWAKTEHGKKMPLDMAVSLTRPKRSNGSLCPLFYIDAGVAMNADERPGFLSHWDSCVCAEQARADARARRQARA